MGPGRPRSFSNPLTEPRSPRRAQVAPARIALCRSSPPARCSERDEGTRSGKTTEVHGDVLPHFQLRRRKLRTVKMAPTPPPEVACWAPREGRDAETARHTSAIVYPAPAADTEPGGSRGLPGTTATACGREDERPDEGTESCARQVRGVTAPSGEPRMGALERGPPRGPSDGIWTHPEKGKMHGKADASGHAVSAMARAAKAGASSGPEAEGTRRGRRQEA